MGVRALKSFTIKDQWITLFAMEWKVLDTGCASAEMNMHFDASLLESDGAQPILHLYEWDAASATYGYFHRPEAYLNIGAAERKGLQLARRPTGGGIIFHLWDMAFSVFIPAHRPEFSPNPLENYAFVNRAVLTAVQAFLGKELPLSLIAEDAPALQPTCSHFCMARPTKYDVLLEGKKIAGAAQRKTKKGFLHQGSIALTLPPSGYLDELLSPEVQHAMFLYTYPLLGVSASPSAIDAAKHALKTLLAIHLNEASLKCCR
jgi:lipoate-protein ligase A